MIFLFTELYHFRTTGIRFAHKILVCWFTSNPQVIITKLLQKKLQHLEEDIGENSIQRI